MLRCAPGVLEWPLGGLPRRRGERRGERRILESFSPDPKRTVLSMSLLGVMSQEALPTLADWRFSKRSDIDEAAREEARWDVYVD